MNGTQIEPEPNKMYQSGTCDFSNGPAFHTVFRDWTVPALGQYDTVRPEPCSSGWYQKSWFPVNLVSHQSLSLISHTSTDTYICLHWKIHENCKEKGRACTNMHLCVSLEGGLQSWKYRSVCHTPKSFYCNNIPVVLQETAKSKLTPPASRIAS